MLKKLSVLLCASAMGLSMQAVQAGDDAAGCGIGKVVMEGKSGQGANIVAAILNDILIPRTFFMTTGVLGCDTTQQVENDSQQKEVFVATNMDNLSQDMAKGQGAYLEALAAVMGIAEKDKAEFFAMTQKEYANLFPTATTGAGEVLTSINTAMLQHPELAKYHQ